MLELVYTLILCLIFWFTSRLERKFMKNRDKHIDESRVYLNKSEYED